MTGIVLGLRWGLETALFLIVVYSFLCKINKQHWLTYAFLGVCTGITIVILGVSIVGDWILSLPTYVNAIANILAMSVLIAITIIIIHLDDHSDSKSHNKIANILEKHATASFVYWISCIFVFHHIFELLGFYLVGELRFLGLIGGLAISLVLAYLALRGEIKLKLHLLINVTTFYLIFQIGAFFADTWILVHPNNTAVLYDLSQTEASLPIIRFVLETLFAVPTHPTTQQFLIQYTVTIGLFAYWFIHELYQNKKHKHSHKH